MQAQANFFFSFSLSVSIPLFLPMSVSLSLPVFFSLSCFYIIWCAHLPSLCCNVKQNPYLLSFLFSSLVPFGQEVMLRRLFHTHWVCPTGVLHAQRKDCGQAQHGHPQRGLLPHSGNAQQLWASASWSSPCHRMTFTCISSCLFVSVLVDSAQSDSQTLEMLHWIDCSSVTRSLSK